MGFIDNQNAQFMLLAGFIIALGLVITTVLLSNIIFQGNMAGEAGSDPAKYEITNLMAISADEMRSAYRNATASGDAQGKFIIQMRDFNGNLSQIYAQHGDSVNVTWDKSNWDKGLYANFTKNGMKNSATNWTVIQNVSSSNIIVNVTSGTFYVITNNNTQITLTAPNNYTISNSSSTPYAIIFLNGSSAAGYYNITGTASGNNFIRARDYVLNATVTFSTSRVRANLTIPVSVPW